MSSILAPHRACAVVIAVCTTFAAANAGCDAPPERRFCATCADAEQPINQLVLPALDAAGHEPVIAGPGELCARLSFDLLGTPMSADEAEATCAGRDIDDVVLELQGRPEYLRASGRFWANRFLTNDVVTDWRYSKELFALVDELHRSELRYDELVARAVAHPGLMVADFDVRGRVVRVFRAFLDRAATDAEQADFGGLFRTWLIGQEPDPDFPTIYFNHAYVLPGLCQPLARCRTTMFGGGEQRFAVVDGGGDAFAPIYVEDFDDDVRAQLELPGRLLASQDALYDAAADMILDRFLAWDEGERVLRTPGVLFPEVRQAVADELRTSGDWPAAERLVLTSWLYTQTTRVRARDGIDVDGDAPAAEALPPYLVGPTKPLEAEPWLTALFSLSAGPVPQCDYRYTDGFPYLLLGGALQQGDLSQEQYNEQIHRLHDLREDSAPVLESFGFATYDTTFSNYARMVGGCPGFQNVRSAPVGVSYALMQQGIVELMCAPGIADRLRPAADARIEDIVRQQVPLVLSRPATDDDVAAVADACGACDGDPRRELGPLTCAALAGSAEFLFR